MMMDVWNIAALNAYLAAAVLIVRGRIARPTDRELEDRTMDEWLHDGSGVSDEEIEAAVHEMQTLGPEQRGAILERAFLARWLH